MTKTLLYVGNLREGGNGKDRVAIFKAAGFAVQEFNVRPYKDAGNRLLRSLYGRVLSGPHIHRMNADLRSISATGGFDAVFVDKGTWVYPNTLKELRSAARGQLAIHFTPDPQFTFHRSRHLLSGLATYDLAITTKTYELDDYRAVLGDNVMFIYQGYSKRIDYKFGLSAPSDFRSDVTFIGHCEPHYAAHLETVSKVTSDLSIWGQGWAKLAQKSDWIDGHVRGARLFGTEYSAALGAAKVSLGLVSKLCPDQSTTRSFEIPASGTFMLAERTDEHMSLFNEGTEAEFFSSSSELREKLQYYLTNDAEREKIAAAGLRRCKASGYSTAEQYEQIVDWIKGRLK